MKQTGEWVKGTSMYRKDYDYRVDGYTVSYIRPVNNKFLLVIIGEQDLIFDDLETAKAVAVALVAMR